MKTHETGVSLRRQLAELVESEIPELTWSGRGGRSTTDLNPMCFNQRGGLKDLFGSPRSSKLEIRSKAWGGGWAPLFSSAQGGCWEDIVLRVMDGRYLGGAERIGEKFEKLTGKEATVYKEY